MATGHIRKRTYKKGISWQVIIDLGEDATGKRNRIFKTVNSTKKEAEKLKTKMLHEIETGAYKEPTETTLREYLKDWLETYASMLSPTTIVGYKANIEGHVIPALGDRLLQKLSAIEIQQFYNTLLQTPNKKTGIPLSTRTIEHIHANLKSALKKAVQLGLIDRNPMDAVVKPKVKEYRGDVFTEGEVQQVLKLSQGTRLEIPILLGAGLGLRRGEILGLKWSSVEFKEGKLKVESNLIYVDRVISFKSPKSEAGERTLVVPRSIMESLKRHKTEQAKHKLKTGELFTDHNLVVCEEDGRPIIPGTLSSRFHEFLKDCNFKQIRFHDLRHTHASLLLKYGVSAKVASSRLGHSNIGITLDLYSHIYGEMEEDAANKLDLNIFRNNAACL